MYTSETSQNLQAKAHHRAAAVLHLLLLLESETFFVTARKKRPRGKLELTANTLFSRDKLPHMEASPLCFRPGASRAKGDLRMMTREREKKATSSGSRSSHGLNET